MQKHDSTAAMLLGHSYTTGEFTKKDAALAEKYLKIAFAEKVNIQRDEINLCLGDLYAAKDLQSYNPDKAIKFYYQILKDDYLCDEGYKEFALVAFKLAQVYENKSSSQDDKIKALSFYEIAQHYMKDTPSGVAKWEADLPNSGFKVNLPWELINAGEVTSDELNSDYNNLSKSMNTANMAMSHQKALDYFNHVEKGCYPMGD